MKYKPTTEDSLKFAYHRGTQHIRAVLDKVCELVYLEQAPSDNDRDALCDRLIDLHQIMYGVTIHKVRGDGDVDTYEQDELYSHGGSVMSRALVDVGSEASLVPPHAYHGDIGEEIPLGVCVHVWHPTEDPVDASEERAELAGPDYWKGCADLRAEGYIDWVRDSQQVIVKRPSADGRLQAVCRITPAGIAEFQRADIEGQPITTLTITGDDDARD